MIRFIDSRYKDLFWLPDGGYLQMDSASGTFISPCTYIDEHHTQVGRNVYHICQLAETLERNGTTYQPEPEIMGDEAAWEVLGADRILLIHVTDEGYNYTIYDRSYKLIDGGVLDYDLELSILKARNQILADFGLREHDLDVLIYEDIVDAIDNINN